MCKKFGYFDSNQVERTLVKYLVDNFCWENIPNKVKNKSLEKIYKRLFSPQGKCQKCLDNRDGFGKFFLQDCNCVDCNLSKATLSKKAEQLYTSLPVFDVVSSQHEQLLEMFGIKYKEISLEDLHNERQDFYNDICTKLGKIEF